MNVELSVSLQLSGECEEVILERQSEERRATQKAKYEMHRATDSYKSASTQKL